MTAIRTTNPTGSTAAPTLFPDGGKAEELRLFPRRRRDPLLARVRARGLDRRLAAGEASHSERLLAVRAARLLTPRSRARLADRWDHLATEARRFSAQDRRRGIAPRGPGAETVGLLEAVGVLLRADRLVLAQGVAVAATTLGIAANHLGPLYDPGDEVVAAAARAALVAMDPAIYSASSAARPR